MSTNTALLTICRGRFRIDVTCLGSQFLIKPSGRVYDTRTAERNVRATLAKTESPEIDVSYSSSM